MERSPPQAGSGGPCVHRGPQVQRSQPRQSVGQDDERQEGTRPGCLLASALPAPRASSLLT